MLTKLKAIGGTLAVIVGFLLIAIIGVAVFFVAAFFFWGIIGLIIAWFIGAMLYDLFSPRSDSPTD